MRRPTALLSTLLFVFSLALAWAPAATAGDFKLSSVQKSVARGDYKVAITALEKVAAAPRAKTAVLSLLARSYLATGQYAKAEQLGLRLFKKGGKKAGVAGANILGTVEWSTGRYKAAIKRLKKEVRKHPKNWEARIILSEALAATGTARQKLSAADEIADYWQEGDVKGAPGLTMLARGLHLTQYYKNANEVFQEATEEDPDYVEAQLHWAWLFLEKEDESNASKSLEEVLKRNPNHPSALAMTALIDMSSENDAPKALVNVRKALATNPHLVFAHQVHAHILIETEQYPEAIVELEKALATNPNDPKTLSMVAACHLLLEDDGRYKAFIKRALSVNRRYAEGYHVVAEYAVRQHRYDDAIALEKKAIKLDPEYWPAYVGLGIGYSRVGKDEKANELLQKAFENDSFNVRAFNMTENFYDGPAQRMTWHKAGAYRLRLPKKQSSLLLRVLRPFLKEAYRVHKKKYSFEPKKPLHIELFADRETFSIRTTGYPMLGAHGVCFGHVVTSISPQAGDFNWAMVLWHELAHVWHIQMSRSRVPRWFTEGLAEHETTLRRPEWKREMDAQLWAAHSAGKLKGIARFNTMFTQAKSLGEIVLAYYYASKVVAFIDKTWGFGVFPKMLQAWGKRQPTDKVFKDVLGLGLADFDKRMSAYLEKDLLKNFANEYAPAAELKGPVAESYRKGQEALKAKQWADAATSLEAVLQAGKDGPGLRVDRARAALGTDDFATARVHLEKAIAADSQRVEAYALLRKVYKKLKDTPAEYALLRKASLMEEHGLGLLLELATMAKELGREDDLVELGERAMHIAPFARETRVLRGEGLLAAGKAKAALAEAELAIDLPSEGKVLAAKLLKARALIALGKKKKARAVLDALGSDPEATKLKGTL